MTERTKRWLIPAAIAVSHTAFVLIGALSGHAAGYWSQERPVLLEILEAPADSITVSHRLCFAAIDAATDAAAINECLSEADQMAAAR